MAKAYIPRTTIDPISIEVAIVGAGPTGLSAAIELSRLGIGDLVVFEREETAGGMPRHCAHGGFGIAEFKRPMSGPDYAHKLVNDVLDAGVNIMTKHTLISIDGDILTFSTPYGLKRYKPSRTLLALGARETPRPARLVSGIRSPNIITTGALQRFVYLKDRKPFEKAAIIGTEAVSFSALITCRHAGIEVAAMIEEEERINMFAPLKIASEYLLKTPVIAGAEHIIIEGKDKQIEGITVHKDGKTEFIECDGVIFSGLFTPESSIMQETFERFDTRNNSAYVSQRYQSDDPRFFVAGNALRGALAAFKCYFEGRAAARELRKSINEEAVPRTITIEADESIAWLSPNMIDIDAPLERLTTLRFKHAVKGTLLTLLNGREVMRTRIDAVPFLDIKLPWFEQPIKAGDRIELAFIKD